MEPTGLIVVDKPGGMTSHDVVSRVRRIAGTRRVGHGGTLDPMATGVLVLGVGRATRLLTYVIGADKRYAATIRLGQATITDDAEGDVTTSTPAGHVTDAAIRAGVAALTGTIMQVPSAVSAIKVNGQRSYHRVRAGEDVVLPAREVTVSEFDIQAIRRPAGAVAGVGPAGGGPAGDAAAGGFPVVDVDVAVACTSGTYIRALARDLGVALGVGGHLTALRRTAVSEFTVADALTLAELAERADPVTLDLPAAAARYFPRRDATEVEAGILAHGGPLAPVGIDGPYAVFAPDGSVLAIVRERDGRARAEVVLAPAN